MAADEDYGLDVSMFLDGEGPPDLDPYFREIDGAEAVAQNIALRTFTPRFPAPGYLIGAEGDGVFLPDFQQARLDKTTAFAVQEMVRGECRKDDRVARVKVDVAQDAAAQRMTVEVRGVLSDKTPFDLVLGVDALTVEMLNQE